jgi:hypothetical protein
MYINNHVNQFIMIISILISQLLCTIAGPTAKFAPSSESAIANQQKDNYNLTQR